MQNVLDNSKVPLQSVYGTIEMYKNVIIVYFQIKLYHIFLQNNYFNKIIFLSIAWGYGHSH